MDLSDSYSYVTNSNNSFYSASLELDYYYNRLFYLYCI